MQILAEIRAIREAIRKFKRFQTNTHVIVVIVLGDAFWGVAAVLDSSDNLDLRSEQVTNPPRALQQLSVTADDVETQPFIYKVEASFYPFLTRQR